MKKEIEKLERGMLSYIVECLWPVGVAGALMAIVIFADKGMVYESCIQGVTLALMLYVWPKARRGF